MLIQSLKKLKNLSGDYPVYAGHGEETTLQNERDYNPFLQD
jgi:glyoxylase-like metal-dependent hydrolase (beta-lactamase superfamily II)